VSLPHILFIDDESMLLDGVRRVLRKSFEVTTAESGAEALARLDAGEAFEVVVSDMQMPQMNGASVLAAFRLRAPDTVRILLTGHADIQSAIAAVNRGQIFRFLTKPCSPEDLAGAIDAAVSQHRLIGAEKVLLEQTLVGSVRALTEVLSLVQPEVFGPSARQHAIVRAVAERLGISDAWHLEVASMLSLVGYVVLPTDLAGKLQRGVDLDASERAMARQMPAVVERVLSCIPRLEKVRDVLAEYETLRAGQPLKRSNAVGAQILDAVSHFVQLEREHRDLAGALQMLLGSGRHPQPIAEALADTLQRQERVTRELRLEEIESGMTLGQDVVTEGGVLLTARGQLVTDQLLTRIRNFHHRVGVVEPILCELPLKR
jgi:CheY-like chemotaxis protein